MWTATPSRAPPPRPPARTAARAATPPRTRRTLAQRADDLQAITDSLLASTDKLLAGLTDVAGSTSAAEADLNKGAEGSLPEPRP